MHGLLVYCSPTTIEISHNSYKHIFLLFEASKRKHAKIITYPINPFAIHVQVSIFSFFICPIRGRLDTFKSLIFGKNNIVPRSFDDPPITSSVTFLAGIF